MQKRLLFAIGGAAAVAVVPAALAHADDGFTLDPGGPFIPYTALGPDGYVGFQPLFTEWQQYQPINVDVPGSSTPLGSYNVFETDYATPYSDESLYKFGDAVTGTDPGGLSGATINDSAFLPSFNAGTEQLPPADVTAAVHDIEVTLGNGQIENMLNSSMGNWLSVDNPGVGSALWFEAPGSTDATLIWSGLADTSAALTAVENLPSLLPYDFWYPGI